MDLTPVLNVNCTKCDHPIDWHYKDGCSAYDCDCERTFGSRVEAPKDERTN